MQDAQIVEVSGEVMSATSLKTLAHTLADEHIRKEDQKRLNVRRKHF